MICDLQRRIGVTPDNLFGPVTARALVDALIAGTLDYTDPDVQLVRHASIDRRPYGRFLQNTLIARMENDPKGPRGKLRWTDGGAWKRSNLRRVDVPGVGPLTVYVPAIPAFISAFGEVATRLPGFVTGRTVVTLCTRRMNWDLASRPSLHSFGLAFDVDLDKDGRYERVEDMDPDTRLFVEILNSWGFSWGGFWPKKHVDGMHLQWSR